MEPFNWSQARSMLSRWGWIEDTLSSEHWSLGGYGQTSVMVPTIENLECRDEYDNFVACIAKIYGLNPFALEASLEAELCQ